MHTPIILASSSAFRKALFERLNLPTAPPEVNPQEFLSAMSMDKKVVAGQIRLVLLKGIGDAEVTANYPNHELVDMLREQFIH